MSFVFPVANIYWLKKHTIYICRKTIGNNPGYDNYPMSSSRSGYGDGQISRGMNSARR